MVEGNPKIATSSKTSFEEGLAVGKQEGELESFLHANKDSLKDSKR